MRKPELDVPVSEFPPTPRSTVRRGAPRGHHDRETVLAILDAGFLCHVGFIHEQSPRIVPFVYARIGDAIYLHGAVGNRMLRSLCEGAEACVSVTFLDGLVLARSAFHHSVNYRSVVLWGHGRAVEDETLKWDALRATVENAIPGRWDDVRAPNEEEMRRTLVVEIPFDEASAKLRTGDPIDDEADLGLDCWAGVIPLRLSPGAPQADALLADGRPAPEYAMQYRRIEGPKDA